VLVMHRELKNSVGEPRGANRVTKKKGPPRSQKKNKERPWEKTTLIWGPKRKKSQRKPITDAVAK